MAVITVIEDKSNKSEKDGYINTLAWMPGQTKEEFVCIGTVTGLLKIIDVKRNKIVARNEVSSYPIFEIDWNSKGIVACSENGSM